ncbi:MAG: (2Fe-2S)-binding protein [Melioribacteraceae bacterium]|nr:(2Fe-2S)-binding protein [Melioribacteraceae bacterium]MCF8263524.1 (2Fe-2S)-binding protein [Melioribacteraceae bacterium]MCF8431535.1 (2Fe-2S)-binding protein [Melioribacteraceae bacterium]
MPKLIIDGKEIEFENGQTIIEVAKKDGLEIPHFCWHPSLSISGNCRVCLVEVEKMPKLVIACSTIAADGMVVNTQSEKTLNARNAVMEFLLINHPLDCPICDEAGECKLQDYAYKHSAGESRFVETKNHKDKRIQLGPRIMFDQERCISCSRCIRFSDEIAKENQLTFVQRGDHVTIRTFPGEEFDNPYTLNTVDICPVGALTSNDFRFQTRVWELSSTESICVGCSRGCNTEVWVRDNEIKRLTPRENFDVNSYWMCDHGRVNTWKNVNADTRIDGCLKDGEKISWEDAIKSVSDGLTQYQPEEILFIGSAFASNEDNFLFKKLAEKKGVHEVYFASAIKPGDADDILIQEDKTPNSLGASKIGLTGSNDNKSLSKKISDGKYKAAFILEDDLTRLEEDVIKSLQNIEFLIVQATNENQLTKEANLVLAASTFAEKHATYTNFLGMVQRVKPAVTSANMDRALDSMSKSRWDKFATTFDRWGRGKKYDSKPGWSILSGILNEMGEEKNYQMAEDVFDELAKEISDFNGMNYDTIGSGGALLKSFTKQEAETV